MGEGGVQRGGSLKKRGRGRPAGLPAQRGGRISTALQEGRPEGHAAHLGVGKVPDPGVDVVDEEAGQLTPDARQLRGLAVPLPDQLPGGARPLHAKRCRRDEVRCSEGRAGQQDSALPESRAGAAQRSAAQRQSAKHHSPAQPRATQDRRSQHSRAQQSAAHKAPPDRIYLVLELPRRHDDCLDAQLLEAELHHERLALPLAAPHPQDEWDLDLRRAKGTRGAALAA